MLVFLYICSELFIVAEIRTALSLVVQPIVALLVYSIYFPLTVTYLLLSSACDSLSSLLNTVKSKVFAVLPVVLLDSLSSEVAKECGVPAHAMSMFKAAISEGRELRKRCASDGPGSPAKKPRQ